MTLIKLDDVLKFLDSLEDARPLFDQYDPVSISWVREKIEDRFVKKGEK